MVPFILQTMQLSIRTFIHEKFFKNIFEEFIVSIIKSKVSQYPHKTPQPMQLIKTKYASSVNFFSYIVEILLFFLDAKTIQKEVRGRFLV